MSNREYFSEDVEKAIAAFGEKIRNLEEQNEALRKENKRLVDPQKNETLLLLLLKWRKDYGDSFCVPFPHCEAFPVNLSPFSVRVIPNVRVS